MGMGVPTFRSLSLLVWSGMRHRYTQTDKHTSKYKKPPNAGILRTFSEGISAFSTSVTYFYFDSLLIRVV